MTGRRYVIDSQGYYDQLTEQEKLAEELREETQKQLRQLIHAEETEQLIRRYCGQEGRFCA